MKKKISIIGGGIAGLTTAYELTQEEDWKQKYDITIYQMGWRCGGKATAGVGENGRIEEVGVHIFQGWYHNAFRMIREIYEEIKENDLAPDNPFKSWKDAFIPNPYTFNTEFDKKNETWNNWTMVFPNNKYQPGTKGNKSSFTSLSEGIGIILEILIGSPFQRTEKNKVPFRIKILKKLFFSKQISKKEEKSEYFDFVNKILEKTFKGLEIIIIKLATLKQKYPANIFLKFLMRFYRKSKTIVQNNCNRLGSDKLKLRRFLLMIELGLVCVEGIYKDVYNNKSKTYDWHQINSYDFRKWLTKHGGSEELLEFSIVRFIYYGTFGNIYGGSGNIESGKIAADIGIKMITKISSYKGCFVWYLAAGTGGTFIAPLVLVLKSRGVKFNYFHKLKEVSYSKTNNIQNIKIDVQVDLKDKDLEYNPFIIQKGIHQWTSKPDYNQIDEEQANLLRKNKIDLESTLCNWKPISSKTLSFKRDFDIVVLATSIKPLKYVAKDIIDKKESWKNMVDHIATTPTLNVQFWLNRDDAELGFHHSQWGLAPRQYPNTVIYQDYLYSWTSMSYIEKAENWTIHKPKQISYWCGVWPENLLFRTEKQKKSKNENLQELKNHTKNWMANMELFWPNAIKDKKFNYDLLCSNQKNKVDKFDSQYFSVNDDPAMQYVLGRPGTNRYRLKSDNTEYDNLFFAGDWTDFGLNVGYMEGTVQSGIQCANSIKKRFFNKSINEREVL